MLRKIIVLTAFITAVLCSSTHSHAAVTNDNDGITIYEPLALADPEDSLVINEYKDTMLTYMNRSTALMHYNAAVGSDSMPMTGYNPFYNFIGVKYHIDSPKWLKYVLFVFHRRVVKGDADLSMPVRIYRCDSATGLPAGTPLNTTYMRSDSIKPNYDPNNTKYTWLRLTDSVVVSGNFAVAYQSFNGTTEYDYTTLYTNRQGDGRSENSSFVITNDGKTEAPLYLSDFWKGKGFKMADGNPPDVDVMIIPVFSSGYLGVDDGGSAFSAGGFRLKSVNPNPSNGKVIFDVAVERQTGLTLSIIDSEGRLVQSIYKQNLSPDEYRFEFDLNANCSGSYFYTIVTDRTKFGGLLEIVK